MGRLSVKDITLIAILAAILTVSQLAFSMVVGINLVFPLFITFTYSLGYKKTMVILLVFVLVTFLIWGSVLTLVLWGWTFSILIGLAFLIGKVSNKNEYVAAVYTAFYFILFGFLCAIQEQILTNVDFWVYWLRGLPSDVLGAIPGFITTLLLLNPLTRIIKQFSKDTNKKYA